MDRFVGDFQRRLHKEVYSLNEVNIIEHCGFILYFCLITSRAGTDIDAAIRSLMLVQADKQVIIAVLYPTIDPEKTIPDSNNAIKKENTYLVDFLFNEDDGFMNCQKNKDAINKLALYIKSKNLTSYYLQNYGNARTYSNQNGEDFPRGRFNGIVNFIRKNGVACIVFIGFVLFFRTALWKILRVLFWY